MSFKYDGLKTINFLALSFPFVFFKSFFFMHGKNFFVVPINWRKIGQHQYFQTFLHWAGISKTILICTPSFQYFLSKQIFSRLCRSKATFFQLLNSSKMQLFVDPFWQSVCLFHNNTWTIIIHD